MHQIEIYIKFYFFFILAITVLFVIGNVVLKPFQINRQPFFTKIFFCTLVGLLMGNVCFAAYKTGGKTVQLLFLLPLIFAVNEFYIFDKKKKSFENDHVAMPGLRSKQILFLIGTSLLLFSFFYFQTIKFSGFPYIFPHLDYLLYNNISYFVNKSGEENVFHVYNVLDSNYHGTKPYHYIESWLNAMIASAGRDLYILHFFLNTLPVLAFIVFLSLLSIFETYKLLNKKAFVLCILLLFFSGISFDLYKKAGFLGNTTNLAPIALHGHFKLLYYYFIVVGSLILIYKNYFTLGFICLLLLPIASITAFPAVAGGLVLFLVLQFKTKLLTRIELKRLFLYTLILSISIPIFYLLFDKAKINMEGTSIKDLARVFLSESLNIKNFKTRFNIGIGSGIQMIVVYLPVLLCSIFCLRILKSIFQQKHAQLIAQVFICIYVAATLAWIVLFRLINGIQLYNNPATVVLNCLIIFLLLEILSADQGPYFKKGSQAFVAVVVLISTYHLFSSLGDIFRKSNRTSYDENYLLSIKREIDNNKELDQGASFKGKNDYNTPFSKYNVCYTLGEYLAFMKDGCIPISMSDFDAPINLHSDLEKERDIQAINLGIFYQFVKRQKALKTFQSISLSQEQFIKFHRIDFCIFSKNSVIPAFIKKRIGKQLLDPISGERFIILEKSE